MAKLMFYFFNHQRFFCFCVPKAVFFCVLDNFCMVARLQNCPAFLIMPCRKVFRFTRPDTA